MPDGIVTVDDAVDVITAEANEDIEKMSAVTPMEDTYLETHPWQMARKCLPWIVILLILDTFSTMVVDKLQYQFNGYTILIAFIPVLMDTGGNAGGQTIAIVIRGLAMKEFEPKECLEGPPTRIDERFDHCRRCLASSDSFGSRSNNISGSSPTRILTVWSSMASRLRSGMAVAGI
jgi:hypothetical protein